MRLGQLSRRINVRSTEIVKFLSSRGISVDDSVNARIEDEHISAVLQHFDIAIKADELLSTPGAGRTEPAAAQPEEEHVIATPLPVEEGPVSSPSIDLNESVQVETAEPQSLSVDDSTISEEQPDVIKAPKVELQGLKILGKIELPEPRKKQQEAAPESSGEVEATATENSKPAVREHRNTYDSTRQKETRQRKNPISLQREREEKAAQQRKEEKAKLEKEKRTLYYQKRVQPTGPIRAARMIDEPVIQLHEEEEDKPKSIWGRFIKWLTT